ncbi:MAG: sulfotransferase [Planctomycetia bacterium]|nr:sulfotransferase [Planctomycetia bacterium]
MADKRKGAKRRKVRPAAPVLDDLPELQAARAQWVKQDLLGALARFDRAVRDNPRHVRALVDASRAFGAMYNYARAEELVDRLLDLGRGQGPILHLAAQSYRLMRRTDQAIAVFHQALAARNPTSESHLELGLLYERRNRLDEALTHAEARLRAQPHDAEGKFLKARVQRRQGALEAAREGLQAIADAPTTHWMTRSRACAELAQLLDEEGAYAEAWQAMLAGKQLTSPNAREAKAHRDRLVPPLMNLAQDILPENFNRWRAGAVDDTPKLALLTGLPRSGTTLLERILDAHPGIVACDEFDAFPRLMFPVLLGRHSPADLSPELLDAIPEPLLAPQRSAFADAMSAAVGQPRGDAWLLDKNPSLLPLITPYLRFAPHGRVIVMLRDPRDVLVSCLMAYLPLNDFSVDFLDLDAAADRLIADLEAWRGLRAKTGNACREIWYEDLIADVRSTSLRILEHLGLPWHDDVDHYRDIGAQRTVFSPSYDRVARPVYHSAVGRWRNYEQQLAGVLPRLTQSLERLRGSL